MSVQSNSRIIKVNYCGFWNDFDPNFNLFHSVLKERYNVVISDDPDFVFCSPLGKPWEYMKYDCVRILYTGEPLSPDFTVFDYAIGFDYIDFGDRYIRYPFSIWRNTGECHYRTKLSEDKARDILHKKKYFCNFIQGHRSDSGQREALFKALHKYKRVESAGTFLNNQKNGAIVRAETKFQLLQNSKFSICAESLTYPGFTTEKIGHSFENYSIPIYLGDPLVDKVYNSKAFINCKDYNYDFNAIVNCVREIDENDELYIKMLCQPITNDENFCHNRYIDLCRFLYNIFDQEPSKAYRRINQYVSQRYENYEKEYSQWNGSFSYRLWKRIKNG